MPSEKLTKKQLEKRHKEKINSFRIELFETLNPLLSIIFCKLGKVSFTMKSSLTESAIIEIAEKTSSEMEKPYFYQLEDDQLQYFLNIIIANLPDLIRNLDFEQEISQSDLDKLSNDKALELEIQEQILKQVTYSIYNTILGFVKYRAATIIGKKYTVNDKFPTSEGKLVKNEEGNLFWQKK